MSLKSSKKVETNIYELEVTVDAVTFAQAITKAYAKQKKSIAVPGFRKGKATQGMIERYYGETIFFENALDIVYPDAVEGAVKEAGLKLVAAPYDVDIPTMSKEDGVVITLKAIVAPEVSIGDYKKLSASKNDVIVTDDEVQAELAGVQERNSRLISVENRSAVDGDTTDIHFDGSVGGVPFDGGKGENYPLVLGSHSFIPGFEEQIVGHQVGDVFDVNVTFPTEYDESLAGKDAIFHVTLNELKTKEMPELDDEFAKDVSEFDTLELYKADLKKTLEEKKAKQAENEFENDLLDALTQIMEAEIPQAMFERKTDDKMNDFAQRLQMQGLTIETYLQYTGSDMESFRKTFAVQAEREVKIDLALEAVVKKEGFTVTEAELEEKYASYATQYKMEVDAIKKAIPSESIADEISIKKAIDLLKETATVKKAEAKKAATPKKVAPKKETVVPKKPAAKKAPAKKSSKAADTE